MLLRRSQGTASSTAGFTLMELILVLAIIALIGLVTWPVFNAWFEGYRLGEGVDVLRTHLVKARTMAIEEGRPYRFYWEPEGIGYRLAPDDWEHWPELADSPAGPAFSATGDAPGLLIEAVLPEGVRFSTLPGEPAVGVCFWPDGTARVYAADGTELPELLLLVVDKFNASRALRVRSLTGGVTVLDLNQVGGWIP